MHGVMKVVGAAILAAGALAARAACLGNDPNTEGTWETVPYQMPINPISATMLRDGRILIVAGSENDMYNHHGEPGAYRAALWDPTGTDDTSFDIHHLEYDVFCSGTAQLPHGRVLIIGGSATYSFTGENRSTFFDPVTDEFAQSQPMTDGRWYGTATTMGDGRIMALSGLNATGATTNRFEIYDLKNNGAGWSAPVTQSFTPPLFPKVFLLPNGRLFYSGHGSGTSNSRGYIYNPATNAWSNSASTTGNRSYGTAVLLPLLPPAYTPKVFSVGGGPNPAKKSTELIDLSASSPAWSSGPDMVTGRIEVGGVLLPNGKVLIHGGSVNNEAPDGPGKKAELYNPASNAFSSAGTAAYSRLYHATSLLLPDARVVSMGSNPGDRGRYLGAIEIYTPPYLYDANDRPITTGRPAITSAPTAPLGYNAGFSVGYTSSSSIASAVLVRPGSVTHSFDMDQRLVGLCGPAPQPACSGSPGTLNLTTPPSGNHAPPGYYMLFLLDAAGVPSHAAWIELSPYSGTPPEGVITTPANDEIWITAGQSVSFGTTTVADKYNWVFSGGTPAFSTAKNPGSVTFNSAGEFYATLTVGSNSGDTDPSPSTREIYVLPQTADFHLDVDRQAVTIHPGQSATFDVTVTPVKGFNGTVTLEADSEGGIPSGVTIAGFSPPTITGAGTSTLTVNTTASASPFALSLSIHGDSGALDNHTATTLLLTLAKPEGLIANASPGQVQLSWLPVTGANGYEIKRSIGPQGAYESLDCTGGTSYTDAPLVNGTTVTYTVVATFSGGPNSGGASAPSDPVTATPQCATPSYAGVLSGTKSGGEIMWAWSAGGASAFDLIRGDLETLRSTGGDFGAAIDALPSGCLANDTSSLNLVDPQGAMAEGEGIFTLIRPVSIACPALGSADDGSSTQVEDRDAEIEAASLSCP